MKKTIAMLVLMLMLISMTACGQTPAENGESQTPGIQNGDQGQPGDDVVPTEPETTLPPEPVKQWYEDESVIMFAVQDRIDVEGDRATIYCYNYKGELINQLEKGLPPVFAENGLAAAYSPQTKHYGYIDRNNVFVIDPIYESVGMFAPDGVAIVEKEDVSGEEFLGLIDSDGNEITSCVYKQLTRVPGCKYIGFTTMEENLLEAILGEETEVVMYGILDSAGNVVVEPMYTSIIWLDDAYFVAKTSDQANFGIYNYSGEALYLLADKEFLNEEKTKYQKESLEIIEGVLWKTQYVYEETANGIDRKETEYMYFDGKEFIHNDKEPEYCIEKKLVSTTNSGNGYGVTVNGQTVIPFQYDRLFEESGYFIGMRILSKTECLLDIYDCDYQKTAADLPYFCYGNANLDHKIPQGYFVVHQYVNGRSVEGIIDYQGNIIVEPVFDRQVIACYYDNLWQPKG